MNKINLDSGSTTWTDISGIVSNSTTILYFNIIVLFFEITNKSNTRLKISSENPGVLVLFIFPELEFVFINEFDDVVGVVSEFDL